MASSEDAPKTAPAIAAGGDGGEAAMSADEPAQTAATTSGTDAEDEVRRSESGSAALYNIVDVDGGGGGDSSDHHQSDRELEGDGKVTKKTVVASAAGAAGEKSRAVLDPGSMAVPSPPAAAMGGSGSFVSKKRVHQDRDGNARAAGGAAAAVTTKTMKKGIYPEISPCFDPEEELRRSGFGLVTPRIEWLGLHSGQHPETIRSGGPPVTSMAVAATETRPSSELSATPSGLQPGAHRVGGGPHSSSAISVTEGVEDIPFAGGDLAPLSAQVVSEGHGQHGFGGFFLSLWHGVPEERGRVYDGVAMPGCGEENGPPGRRSSPSRSCSGGRKLWGFVAIGAAAIGAVIAVSVVMRRPPSPTEDKQTPIPDFTFPPTPAPLSGRAVQIEGMLLELLPGNVSALMDRSTPQHEALLWLADDDPLRVDPQDDKGLIQRFVLAVLYFATDGKRSWLEQCGFLSEKHECYWNEEVLEIGTEVPLKGAQCTHDNETIDMLVIPINNLTGTLPDEIGALSGLAYLGLWQNTLYGTIPSTLGQEMMNLERLGLHQNFFTGFIPSSLGKLANLKQMLLVVNFLTGTIPPSLGQLSSLAGLFLEQNNLVGSIPASLNNMTKLDTVFLGQNSLTGTLPFAPESFPNLRILDIGMNNLDGTIPLSIFTYSNLQAFRISRTMIGGTVPNEIGDLTNLRTLILHNNTLRGTIPSSIARLRQLDWLNLALNRLSSTIPNELGTLSKLKILFIAKNDLTGTLPSTIGNLVALEDVQLQENRFTGTVPQSFSQLKSVIALSLENNSITGDIDFLCDIPFTLLSADCFGDEPEVSCGCCHGCCSDELGKDGPVFGCFIPEE